MSKLQEIKDQYAKEKGYRDWVSLLMGPVIQLPVHVDEVCRRYATACCKATLEKCAENAFVSPVEGQRFEQEVNQQSILSPDNIVIL